jgi:hypothetical protein
MYPSRSMNLVSFFCLCFIFVLSGCGGGGGGGGGDVTPPANLPPLADAGQDQFTYTSDQVTLTGVSSDSDGTVVSHQWTQTEGPQVDFSGATTSTLIFTPLTETASYTFQYTATDDDGAQQSDTVSVYASKILFSDSFDDNSSLSNWVLENDTVYMADWDVLNGELFQNNSVDVQSFLDSYHLGTFPISMVPFSASETSIASAWMCSRDPMSPPVRATMSAFCSPTRTRPIITGCR